MSDKKIVNTKRVNIDVPISEWDLEDFKNIVFNDDSFSWSFQDRTGEFLVSVNFVSNEELEEV